MEAGQDEVFREQQIRAILKQAAALQQREGGGEHPGGLTRAELEQVAAEAGIGPQYVAQAIALLQSGGGTRHASSLTGGPFRIELERTFAGELPASEWDQVVQEIRRTFEVSGQTSQLGDTLEWVAKGIETGNVAEVVASVRPRNGKTAVRLYRTDDGVVFISYLFSTIFGTLLSSLTMAFLQVGFLPGLAVVVVTLATLLTLVRFQLQRWHRRQRQKMQQLLDRIGAMVQDTAAPKRLEQVAEPRREAARITLPEPAKATEPEARPRRRTR